MTLTITVCLPRRLSAPLEVIYEVCVYDIDRPWELHHVTSHTDKVVALEWHQSGTKLLIATSFGKCQVWEMKVLDVAHAVSSVKKICLLAV